MTEKKVGWFSLEKVKDYLYVIRERLDEIDPRYLTKFTNLYILVGSEAAILIDTGCGLYPIKPLVDEIVSGKRLYVINTHSDFDHVGGNHEFELVNIHELEADAISHPMDFSLLRDSPKKSVKQLEKFNYLIPPSKRVYPIHEGDQFYLGGLQVGVLHTPGHSPGSISLYTDRGEIFTGDMAHYGAVYLPPLDEMEQMVRSINKTLTTMKEENITEVFPSHEQYKVGSSLLMRLKDAIMDIRALKEKKGRFDTFLDSYVIKHDGFLLITK